MSKFLLCAALLLALSGSALSGSIRIVVGGMAPKPATPANAVAGNAPNPATRANDVASATDGKQPAVPRSSCSNAKSPSGAVTSGSASRFKAELSGSKNIKPNTTGITAAVEGPSRGTYLLVVDEQGKKASWTLELCDVPAYVASHLHTGSPRADFVPPLIPLEPYVKPANPFAPPELLPQFCPPVDITGCTYTAKGSFSDADIAPLLGREPRGDLEAPSVTSWSEFLEVLKDGKIYANVHSKLQPAGLMRGNLMRDDGSSGRGSGSNSSGSGMGSGMGSGSGSGTMGSGSGSGSGTLGSGSGSGTLGSGSGSGTGTLGSGSGTGTGTLGSGSGTGTGTLGSGSGTGTGTLGSGTSTGTDTLGSGTSTGTLGSGSGSGTLGSGSGSGTLGSGGGSGTLGSGGGSGTLGSGGGSGTVGGGSGSGTAGGGGGSAP